MIDRVFSELKLKYIYVDSTALLSRYFSETESKIRQIFEFGRTISPSVIVFDGLDGIVGKRSLNGGESDGGLNERIITTLLTELDGVETSYSRMVVIGIANSIEKLDEAIIRPGRLGTHIYVKLVSIINHKVGYPSFEDREEIIKKSLWTFHKEDPLDIKLMAERSEGLSTGQLGIACVRSIMSSILICSLDESRKESAEKAFLEQIEVYKGKSKCCCLLVK